MNNKKIKTPSNNWEQRKKFNLKKIKNQKI